MTHAFTEAVLQIAVLVNVCVAMYCFHQSGRVRELCDRTTAEWREVHAIASRMRLKEQGFPIDKDAPR